MRTAVVQSRTIPGSRAANLARVLRWIDQACAAEPSPDLVILLGGSDGPALCPFSQAVAQGFTQSVALKAREWGTFVAVGFQAFVREQVVPAAALFDPDGDAIAFVTAAAGGAEGNLGLGRTPYGRWALLLAPGEPWPADLAARLREADARLAVVLGTTDALDGEIAAQRCATLAREARLPVCLGWGAGSADAGSGPIGCVWDAAGEVAACGTRCAEVIVTARLKPGPVSGDGRVDGGGGADAAAAERR